MSLESAVWAYLLCHRNKKKNKEPTRKEKNEILFQTRLFCTHQIFRWCTIEPDTRQRNACIAYLLFVSFGFAFSFISSHFLFQHKFRLENWFITTFFSFGFFRFIFFFHSFALLILNLFIVWRCCRKPNEIAFDDIKTTVWDKSLENFIFFFALFLHSIFNVMLFTFQFQNQNVKLHSQLTMWRCRPRLRKQ